MKDKDASPEQVAHAAMARGQLARLQSYLQRGRSLKDNTTVELRELWVNSFREWSNDARHRPLANDDAEAELELRGEKVPYDAVKIEMEAIIAAAEAAYKKMTDEELQRAGERMYSEYEKDKAGEN